MSKNAVALWLRITNPYVHFRRIANPLGRVTAGKSLYAQSVDMSYAGLKCLRPFGAIGCLTT